MTDDDTQPIDPPSAGAAPGAPRLRWGAATHTGRVRSENEDDYVAEPLVFGVADGMGGHQAGEVASRIAADTLRDRLAGGVTRVDVVQAAVVEANAAIFQAAHSNTEHRGMGTTLTALVVLRDHAPHGTDRFVLVNVGDSRTYAIRNGAMRRVTRDHSYVQELVDTGHITEFEARTHPRRNIVTRALGIEPTVRVDTAVVPMVRGDRFVLCSDGLVDEVPEDDVLRIALAHADPQEAAEALVAAANEAGGHDNVTVVVVDVMDGIDPPDTAPLDIATGWVDDDGTEYGPVDADPGNLTSSPTTGARGVQADPLDDTAEHPMPFAQAIRKRRLTPGTFLFAFAVGVIVTVTAVMVAVVVTGDDAPAPTTTTVPDTTVPTSTTTTTTTPGSTTTPPTSGADIGG